MDLSTWIGVQASIAFSVLENFPTITLMYIGGSNTIIILIENVDGCTKIQQRNRMNAVFSASLLKSLPLQGALQNK
jgi:hypothetical protein